MGEGSHCVSGVYVCMCVSSSDSTLPLISLPLPFFSLSSPPPPFCVFPVLLSLLAVSGEHQLLHYRDGERPPPRHTHTHHTHNVTTVHYGNHTGILPSLLCWQMESFGAHHCVLLFFRLMWVNWVRLVDFGCWPSRRTGAWPSSRFVKPSHRESPNRLWALI